MRRLRTLGLAAPALVCLVAAMLWAPSAEAAFGVVPGSFLAKAHGPVPLLEAEGELAPDTRRSDLPGLVAAAPLTQAGAHPDASASFTLTSLPSGQPDDNVKDAVVDLPPGFLGDPTAVPACSRDSFAATYRASGNALPITDGCPPASQVGVATLHIAGLGRGEPTVAVYRITTALGSPASFGIAYQGVGILLRPGLRSSGDYGLTVSATDINAAIVAPIGATVTLWGVPASPVHDPERVDLEVAGWAWGVGSRGEERPFLSNSTDCTSGPLPTFLSLDSWQAPGAFLPADPADPAYVSVSPEPTGCERLRFGGPSAPADLAFQPATHAADTPSAFEARLALPYSEDPDGLANPPLRDITVTLPEGVVANPSSAVGLAACTEAEIGYLGSGFPEPRPIRFDEEAPRCPDASKIGTAVVHTPLLEAPLEGSVYLAAQGENPFDSLLAIYLAIDDPATGIVVKLAGRVDADPASGRLTASFTDNPQLPFTELDLRLFGGPGAPLANPPTCAAATTTSTLTPWSAPDTPEVSASHSFALTSGPGASPCAASESALPAKVSFEAGTENPLAGAYSPFVLRLSREDGTQRISRIDTTLPTGLLARLAGVSYCPDAALLAAAAHTGREEQASPSCPQSSRIGSVDVAAGVGPVPVHVAGSAYLAGPYEGAPLSLAVITPALAGPFDLGTVVVRVALHVDESTAQVTATSDPLPRILQGIPLGVRQVTLHLDTPRFTLNPTSCEPKHLAATETSTLGTSVPLGSHFQVADCGSLSFKPSVKVSLEGSTDHTGHPALKAVVTYPPGGAYSNIARAQVSLPHSELLDQGNIAKACTRVLLNQRACPASSVYGHARAWTPLLDAPLEGPVYLVGGYGYKLPALVAELDGQIRVMLVGRIDTGKNKGIRTTFESVPDAPVSRFELRMKGGKRYGLLVNSEVLCSKTHKAAASFTAQDGRVLALQPKIAADCPKATQNRKSHRTRH